MISKRIEMQNSNTISNEIFFIQKNNTVQHERNFNESEAALNQQLHLNGEKFIKTR
jgi:hypothetical protein